MTCRWELYDPVIGSACHAYTALFNFKYKNIFCFLCNEPFLTLTGTCQFAKFGETDLSKQCRPRSDLEEQSDQDLHCLPFRQHRLDSLLYGTAI